MNFSFFCILHLLPLLLVLLLCILLPSSTSESIQGEPSYLYFQVEGENKTSIAQRRCDKGFYLRLVTNIHDYSIDMKPYFPKGFTIYDHNISVNHPEAIPPTIFTITVSSPSQSASAELPIEIIGCNGIFTQVFLNKCTLVLKNATDTITLTSKDCDYICLSEVEYTYTLSCTEQKDVILGRNEYNDYSFILDGRKESGVIDLSGKTPLVEFPTRFISSHFIEAFIFVYGRIKNSWIEPELPGSVQLYDHHLNGCVNEPISQNYTLFVEHANGNSSFPFSIFILTCPQDHLFRFQSKSPIEILNDRGEVILSIINDRNDMACLPDHSTLLIKANDTVSILNEQGVFGVIDVKEEKLFHYDLVLALKGVVSTLRQSFVVSSLAQYTNGIVSLSFSGLCEVFVNEQLVGSYTGEGVSLLIPLHILKEGKNEIRVQSASVWDLQVLLVSIHFKELTVAGEAVEDQIIPDGKPEYAFKNDEHYSWKANSLPASIAWSYVNQTKLIVNQVRFYFDGNYPITEFTIEGVNEEATLLYRNQADLFPSPGYYTIDFENEKAFAMYRLNFLQGQCFSFSLKRTSLLYVNRVYCERNKSYFEEGDVLSIDCPKEMVGFQNMICSDVDYKGVWMNQDTMCVEKNPPKNKVFFDFVLRLNNVTLESWEEMKDEMTELLLQSFSVRQKDINYVGTRVVDSLILDVYIRFTIFKSGAEYISDQLKEGLEDVNSLIQKKWEAVTGEIVSFKEYKLPDLTGFVCTFIIIIILLMFILYIMTLKKKESLLPSYFVCL